jgi:hypothetical protein
MSQSQAPSALIFDLDVIRAGLTGELAAISLIEALRRQAAGIAAASGIRIGEQFRDRVTGEVGTVAYFLGSGEAVLQFKGRRLAVRIAALEAAEREDRALALAPEPEPEPAITLPSDCEVAS